VGRGAVSEEPEPVPAPSAPTSCRIDQMVDKARSTLRRARPHEAASIWASGGLLVDIRPASQRAEFGEIPGAIVIERNVLEWRLDPTSPHRHEAVNAHDQYIVVLCQAGYASSLAAASLRQLGLSNATDVIGGYEAWALASLPTTLTGSKISSGHPTEVRPT
jgi:rhodanese-related sulfurtransferase